MELGKRGEDVSCSGTALGAVGRVCGGATLAGNDWIQSLSDGGSLYSSGGRSKSSTYDGKETIGVDIAGAKSWLQLYQAE